MTIPHLLTACLWLLAAAAPAAGRPGPSARLLQQDPASSAAAPAYEAQARPAYFAGAGGSASASGPAAEQGPASHYRFADVGSASAAAVEGAIAAGDAGAFAAAAAAAGPEAAGRAVTEAIRGGRGPALAQLVAASGNAAATDAFLTGLWPAFCLDPPATAQTVVEAVSAGGAAASAAAHAAAIGARQCCGATRVALDQAASIGGPGFTDGLARQLAATGLSLPDCAAPAALAQRLGVVDSSGSATVTPGTAPTATPAASTVGALALGVAPLPAAPAAAIARPVGPGPAAESSLARPLAAPEYSAAGLGSGGGGP